MLKKVTFFLFLFFQFSYGQYLIIDIYLEKISDDTSTIIADSINNQIGYYEEFGYVKNHEDHFYLFSNKIDTTKIIDCFNGCLTPDSLFLIYGDIVIEPGCYKIFSSMIKNLSDTTFHPVIINFVDELPKKLAKVPIIIK